MGSATAVGYRHHRANAAQRAVQSVAATRPGAWTFARVLPPVDRVLHRLSKGRTTVPQVLAGLPVVMVTTTGRRSGRPRTAPLVAVPLGDDLALLGTNFGGPSTPGWVWNLEAEPYASVSFEGRTCAVHARPADDDERAEVWSAADGVYPGYARYRSRVIRREIRIFVLEVAAG